LPILASAVEPSEVLEVYLGTLKTTFVVLWYLVTVPSGAIKDNISVAKAELEHRANTTIESNFFTSKVYRSVLKNDVLRW
jgi:hypothetical protein